MNISFEPTRYLRVLMQFIHRDDESLNLITKKSIIPQLHR